MKDILTRLLRDLEQRIQNNGRAVLVIDGDCAAGKTTLAARTAARLTCSVFHMDDFFLPPAMRTKARLSEAGGNVHYERFLSQVLLPLQKNAPFVYGAYSCADDTVSDVSVTPESVAVIEGSYALHPRFLPAYRAMDAVSVFIRIPEDEQIMRIKNRDGEEMLHRFRAEWIPMEKAYQAACVKEWGGVLFTDG